ncbi:putative F-box/LRR-repeat protein 23 [Papaver somniferum]|uniref:putative F-box/LRR-repeat protein 23 n=1 Tax=Papaver somniferum TaxID=3469 RepID=UPI000E7030E6|nr:putative F-box/LRR-repeat protein 23 [Papaver somniferum]XP_026393238.1 putative F-box/LRR-repeat protein 23 [Papaver somniferum]
MKKNKNNLEVMDNQTPISSEEVRNWLELPPNVLSLIFLKLGAIDILLRAQSVCSVWRKASKKPLLFRSIDIRNSWDLFEEQCDMMIGRVSFNGNRYDMQKMVREAVNRSCGQLVDFSLESFASNELLAYTAEKSSSLRCLRLVHCYQVSDDTLINMAKKASMLEELEICHCSFSLDTLKAVGNACHQLKLFRLNSRGYDHPGKECDDVALAIAENMPELRHLHLFGNKLTNVGLKAILDACLHLESLDLRQCLNVNLEGDLLITCRDRLIKLRFPNDSSDDCEFDAAIIDHDNEFYHIDSGVDDDSGYSDSSLGL